MAGGCGAQPGGNHHFIDMAVFIILALNLH
jgi:hypothetical protein